MIKPWVTNLPWDVIKKVSKRKRVNYLLIGAIVSAESNGDPRVTRFEPGYRWLFEVSKNAKANVISYATEKSMQMSSIGLMQILGANARVLQFKGHLSELYKPEIGLEYGIRHLVILMNKYSKLSDAISAYNQGSAKKLRDGTYKNKEYVDKILSRYQYLKDMR